jgi:hypothetical protein
VAGSYTTQDCLNKGDTNDNAAKDENGAGVHDNDNRDENDSPTIRSVCPI